MAAAPRLPRPAAALLAAAALALTPLPAGAHGQHDPQDNVLAAIGVDEKLGSRVPADLPFTDQDGRPVRLSDYLGGGPVLLTLNYYTCPMLCPLTLDALLGTTGRVTGLSPARDYRIVTASIDPEDGPERARAVAGTIHAKMEGVADPGRRWPFLTGPPASIEALARSVGFRYVKVGKEYAHADVAIVLTPDGTVSRYLYGIQQSPRDLKLALVEAAGGRIGESRLANTVLLYCFHYDPAGRKYALYATNIMKAGGVLTLVLFGGLYLLIWRRRGAGKPPAAPEGRG